MKRDGLPSLLLLPFPPHPSNRQVLNAAYRPPLTAALSALKGSEKSTKLIVAVACPILHGQFVRSKTLSWSEAQSLVAGIYTIISVVCSQLSIATEVDGGPGTVDTAVILVDHDRKKRFSSDDQPKIETNNTVIVDLATFACAYHPWNLIFHVRCEAGLQLYQTYLQLAEGKQKLLQEQLIPVEGGLTMNVAQKESSSLLSQTSNHQIVCLGGTFDHLHPGHKLLLTAGALLLQVPRKDSQQPCEFIIGITGDELLKNKKYAEYVQSWEDRARNVILFLWTILELPARGCKDNVKPRIEEKDGDFRASFRDGTIRVQCVRIQDAFGPTVTREDINALVVSAETRSGGRAVNDRRAEQGWHALEVFEVDVLNAEEISDDLSEEATKTENFASKISSTAIRQQRAAAQANAQAQS
ncbi:Phosphopantetheine adenylyltransferase [Diplogelasinospora grovesii]|uniref:Phosphopantetheine adenylyltransferase n=1 Tax=Diplogelasinospora grovesii TaxID=303347 RepID=A0AAN6S3I1_9PEZI|nr:Phosphopantetheine adenylyltransferase [Diplogelasinospora grovesii]